MGSVPHQVERTVVLRPDLPYGPLRCERRRRERCMRLESTCVKRLRSKKRRLATSLKDGFGFKTGPALPSSVAGTPAVVAKQRVLILGSEALNAGFPSLL
jgi:hypothetical protein